MKPTVVGFTTYFLMWPVAAIVGIWTGLQLARRAGFPRARSLLALCAAPAAIAIGSKLLYLIEHVVFPNDDPFSPRITLAGMRTHGFRIPGGIALLSGVIPLVCRPLGLPSRRFVDATIPAVGLAILCLRLGCFFNGCCFGRITDLPIGVSFPPGARVYGWQLINGLIGPDAFRSLPVHPLQLYYAAFGLLLYGLGRWWQERKRFDGEVWLKVSLLFFVGTFVLELQQATVRHVNVLLGAVGTAVTVMVAVCAHRRAGASAALR